MNIFNYIKELWRGKDLYRIFMNEECKNCGIEGKVLDIGSGLQLASYHRFLRRDTGAQVESMDLRIESGAGEYIDLEEDLLPHTNASVDTVLLFNVLEHLYNFPLILSEIRRVLKSGGVLIGAVPFLVAYHPDPHDYWRFTQETLEKIFVTAGFSNIQIKPFGYGPVSAGFSQIEMVLPRLLKAILLPMVLLCDKIIIALRSQMNQEKFSLGLFFRVTK